VARTVVINRDSDRARSVGNGLRVTAASTVRTATDDPYACAAIVAAYGTILAEGSEFIQEVAGAADQCVSDITTLTQAWPKLNTAETPSVK